MTLHIDKDGTLMLYQGDSGEIVISGLNAKKKYLVYFAIQDVTRNIVGEELQVAVNNADSVTFVLTPEYTDLLKVAKNKPFEIYYYGVKACEVDTSNEDTLFIADSTYGDLNRIIVYPRKVMGNKNGTE